MDRITLNKDIFYHMFDFLRIDGLFACQFLSKDIHQRVLQRISINDNKELIQIKNIKDFVELFTAINGTQKHSNKSPISLITNARWFEINIRCYVEDLALKNTRKEYRNSYKNIYYRQFSIHDVYVYFHAEFVLDIADDKRTMNRAIFRHGYYNVVRLRKMYEQVLASCDSTWFTTIFKVDKKHCLIAA